MNRSSSVRLISVDLDGTLFRSDRTPASEGVRLLQSARRAGVLVVTNTTRNIGSVRKLCRAWDFNDPVICTNGAQIFASPGGPVWASYTIPMVVARSVARLADDSGWEVSTSVGNRTYLRQRPGQPLGLVERPTSVGSAGRQDLPQSEIVPTNEEALVAEPVRMLLHEREAIAAARDLAEHFPQDCRTETYYKPDGRVHSLCVLAREADKGKALEFVGRKLEIPLAQTLAIGDNPNDMPMFAAAGVGVAMGNAPPAVKAAATVVGPSNDDEGVAWTVRRFVLRHLN